MPHSVGGAMGVTLCHCREKGNTHFDIISLNIDRQLSTGCSTLTSTADFCLLGKAPSQLFYSSSQGIQ